MAKKKVKKSAKPKHVAPARKMLRTRRPKKITPIQLVVRSASVQVPKPQRQTPVAPLSEDQIDRFRDVLSQKRDDLLAIVQRKKEEEIQDVGVGDEADV